MLQVPAVPEVSTCAHPVLLSKPLEKSVVGVVPQEAVKETPVTFAEETVTDREAGVKVQPLFEGVTVYVPFASPAIVKFPEASLVADFVPAVTVALAVPALPEIEYVVVPAATVAVTE